ncbi:xanthine dehydrogenase family protein molybdopterin-binding subunit [Chelatococcus daeguensis]|uniref:xanthine dehydrogenase family protein molybdopterin-binding subunit n=1 Tax=Chelatococcus daeguensis TaxID=444444 RepID=UPI0007AB8201|nr:molybdopterin cofactor-binding domain-containing protein [Chelatococcus daeguensis]KZE35499.1 aldehyde dehydrogenase [Chelatococcus daeguensis]MBM3085499.1 xanthine dehydrogenase family protein molybdopterin-binding subunit [Chelatococcus daeguensis]
MTIVQSVSRRNFLVGSAAALGGLSLGFHLPLPGKALAADAAPEINAWVVVKPDETVVIRIARSEMGQGTLTGLAQLVAEELDCDWARVTTEYPTPGENLARSRVWGNFSTGGSRGIRESHDYVRQGGAAARQMLIAAAAADWGVPAGECTTDKGTITHAASGRSTTYGKVADAAGRMTPPAEVTLKDPKDWTIAGQPLPRLDTADKLTGKQIYGTDLQLDGMLNAAIKACPVFGGKVQSFDAPAVADMPGVRKVVQVGETALAVVADTWWRAKTALDALPIVWDEGPNTGVTSATIAAMLEEGLDADEAFIGHQRGNAREALAGAARMVSAVYGFPYQNHATMEPMNATALYTPEKCEVWVPTQNGEASLAAAAEASGLPVNQCEVYKIHLGGGFGRRGMQDYVTQVVHIAKEFPGTPVKLIWSREEDMLQGRYHPVTQGRLTGALDADGNLTALHMRISGQSILAAVMPQRMQDGMDPLIFQGLTVDSPEGHLGYTIPNLLIDHAMRNPPVPPGFWRGVNLNQNAIYLECFLDELAHAAGQDPLAFRRKLMANHPKHLAVLNAVAERIGWDEPAPEGRHRGLAQIMGFGSYVAAAEEVSVTDGRLRIHRIVAATDPGHAVNPAQIERQVEGSFVYGLSACLYGECTVNGGRIEQENFDTYDVMRMADMPAVETIVMPSGGFWGGVGEPTIAVAAPAVLNAIFAATGKRIRQLPLKNHSLV